VDGGGGTEGVIIQMRTHFCPGGIEAAIGAGGEPHEFGMMRMQAGASAMPCVGKPEELANVALMLVSDEASFVNGSIVFQESSMNFNELFIEPEGVVDKRRRQSASYLRREFVIEHEIAKATLTITACGIYKAYINGAPISEEQFMPGCTYYMERLQYQTVDVTSFLKQGVNVIAAVVGDGWWRGKLGANSKRNVYGDKLKLMAVLEIEHEDGAQTILATDERWKATQQGPIRENDWKDGEVYDATMEMPGWTEAGFDDRAWHPVYLSAYAGKVVSSAGEKILEHERFMPKVLTTPDGSAVLDFVQNIFGYVEFTVSGPRGHKVKLRHGETLDEKGSFTLENLNIGGPIQDKLLQEVDYTLKEGTQSYKPSFTAHGFRYVKLINWPEAIMPEHFTAIAVYSDMKETGFFECSHPQVNQLVHNAKWSQKGNFLDVPTDCPTRERAGWTGDIAVFCEAGSYQFDTYTFLTKWLKDLAAQQKPNGSVANIVPSVGFWEFIDGSAAWGDAAVIVPYTLYKMFGKQEVLETQYTSIKKWLGFLENRAHQSNFVNRFNRNPYQEYIIDVGYHWGEWLEPGHTMAKDFMRNLVIPDSEVATAYYAYAAGLLSEIAAILGDEETSSKYRALSQKVKEAYRYTFTKDGVVQSDRQARYVRPIALNLLSDPEKAQNAALLNEMVVKNAYCIGAGFLTTPFILPVLTDYGYVDTAYKMIENTKRPGWLYNVSKGATTIWENWNGIDDRGKPTDSFNHYAFGAVTQWFFTRVAGITPLEPGFAKIQIKPIPGGSFDWVKCTFESVQGPIQSNWRIDNGQFLLNIEVPAPTEVHLPNGQKHSVERGQYEFRM